MQTIRPTFEMFEAIFRKEEHTPYNKNEYLKKLFSFYIIGREEEKKYLEAKIKRSIINIVTE